MSLNDEIHKFSGMVNFLEWKFEHTEYRNSRILKLSTNLSYELYETFRSFDSSMMEFNYHDNILVNNFENVIGV